MVAEVFVEEKVPSRKAMEEVGLLSSCRFEVEGLVVKIAANGSDDEDEAAGEEVCPHAAHLFEGRLYVWELVQLQALCYEVGGASL